MRAWLAHGRAETGLGAESEEWSAVQAMLAPRARVCRSIARRVVRAMRHLSRVAPDLVEDLRALLLRADVMPPYVLVGHSFGGLLVRLFAHCHPEHVAALVLVDTMHEDQFDVFAPAFRRARRRTADD
jgi:pimeloyl-ACP methyl ester carboxylesterase